MIKNDFIIDFKNKKISYNSKKGGEMYTINAFYSYLQNIFAKEQNMKYQTPIMAMSKTEFFLINGWTIDKKIKKCLKSGTLFVSNVITELDSQKS